MIVFNDDNESKKFEMIVCEANEVLVDIDLKLEYNLIKGGFYPNGEYPYTLTLEKINE